MSCNTKFSNKNIPTILSCVWAERHQNALYFGGMHIFKEHSDAPSGASLFCPNAAKLNDKDKRIQNKIKTGMKIYLHSCLIKVFNQLFSKKAAAELAEILKTSDKSRAGLWQILDPEKVARL